MGALLLNCVPVAAAGTPITAITFVGQTSAPAGYTKISQDLNEGKAGVYIYLCYSKIESLGKPITGLYIIEDSQAVPSGYTKIPQDLNQGAGGELIYLCYTTTTLAGSPITGIKFVTGEGASAPSGYTKINTDLNDGAGGSYIYLCYTRQ